MKKVCIGLIISAAVVGGFTLAQSMTTGFAANGEKTNTKLITEQEARDIALKKVNGTIIEMDDDRDDNRPHYEFDIQNNQEEVSVEVDAVTGKATITERETIQTEETVNEKQANTAETTKADGAAAKKTIITKAKAMDIAKTVAKGTVTKVKLDKDDDQTQKYELEFKDGNVEYDVEIDAYTGKILEVEQELED